MAMAEFGCDHATIPEDILLQLSMLDGVANPPPGDDVPKKTGVLSPRVADLLKVDPLSGPDWDGALPSTQVDYLQDNGAALTQAIAADSMTEKGLYEALEAFKGNELQSRRAIEEAMKQF